MSKIAILNNKRLQFLPFETIQTVINDLNINVPRSIYRLALSEALKIAYQDELDNLKQKKEADLALDEIKKLRRYSELSSLSTYQLHQTMPAPLQGLAVATFYTVFWEAFTAYLYDTTTNDNYLTGFFEDALKVMSDDLHPAFEDFQSELQPILEDKTDHCDGLEVTQFRETLEKTANATEIRAIGKTYNVDVPRTLKKEQFRIILEHELKAKKAWQEHFNTSMQEGTLKDLQAFAKTHGVAYENYMTKQRMITYLTHRLLEKNNTSKNIKPAENNEKAPVIESDMIKVLQDELREIKQLLKDNYSPKTEKNDAEESAINPSNTVKEKYNRLLVLDIFAGAVLLFLVFGLFTYVGRNWEIVQNINTFFNRLSYRGYGVMELYHTVIGFIVYGE